MRRSESKIGLELQCSVHFSLCDFIGVQGRLRCRTWAITGHSQSSLVSSEITFSGTTGTCGSMSVTGHGVARPWKIHEHHACMTRSPLTACITCRNQLAIWTRWRNARFFLPGIWRNIRLHRAHRSGWLPSVLRVLWYRTSNRRPRLYTGWAKNRTVFQTW